MSHFLREMGHFFILQSGTTTYGNSFRTVFDLGKEERKKAATAMERNPNAEGSGEARKTCKIHADILQPNKRSTPAPSPRRQIFIPAIPAICISNQQEVFVYGGICRNRQNS